MKLEYSCALYCNATDSRPVQGDREEAGGTGGGLCGGGNRRDLTLQVQVIWRSCRQRWTKMVCKNKWGGG